MHRPQKVLILATQGPGTPQPGRPEEVTDGGRCELREALEQIDLGLLQGEPKPRNGAY